jgi:hypothetical protein
MGRPKKQDAADAGRDQNFGHLSTMEELRMGKMLRSKRKEPPTTGLEGASMTVRAQYRQQGSVTSGSIACCVANMHPLAVAIWSKLLTRIVATRAIRQARSDNSAFGGLHHLHSVSDAMNFF